MARSKLQPYSQRRVAVEMFQKFTLSQVCLWLFLAWPPPHKFTFDSFLGIVHPAVLSCTMRVLVRLVLEAIVGDARESVASEDLNGFVIHIRVQVDGLPWGHSRTQPTPSSISRGARVLHF